MAGAGSTTTINASSQGNSVIGGFAWVQLLQHGPQEQMGHHQ